MIECKVCGSIGKMALNRNGNETDTCPVCMKKYRRMQRLYYSYIKQGKGSYEQRIEFNTLVTYLQSKTELKPVDIMTSIYKSTGERGITKEVNPFKLYAPMPREVLRDDSFYLFNGEHDNKETDARYPNSMCSLMDTLAIYSMNDYDEIDEVTVPHKKHLKVDIASWFATLAKYYYDNEELMKLDTELERFSAYHWLCYMYCTVDDTIKANELSVPSADYKLYTYDMLEDDIVRK